ncbi:hypothetical protein ACWDA7_50260 [Streptomyces sp. NPDC001156]
MPNRRDRVKVLLRGVLQQRGLEQRQAPTTQGVLGQSQNGVGVADLQYVDLEPG